MNRMTDVQVTLASNSCFVVSDKQERCPKPHVRTHDLLCLANRRAAPNRMCRHIVHDLVHVRARIHVMIENSI